MTLPVPLDGFYHYGVVVRDFDAGLDELGSQLGLEWATTVRRQFPVAQPNGLVEADFRVILMECRGTGESEHTEKGYHLEQYAADVLGLLNHLGLERVAFAGHSMGGGIVFLLGLFGIGMFPELIHAHPDTQHSMTAYNAASSTKTLQVMLIMALIGMPLVLGYTFHIYRIFRGKVKLDSMSY